jgi:hypothetical protein
MQKVKNSIGKNNRRADRRAAGQFAVYSIQPRCTSKMHAVSEMLGNSRLITLFQFLLRDIVSIEINKDVRVHTAWDLGVKENALIGALSIYRQEVRPFSQKMPAVTSGGMCST